MNEEPKTGYKLVTAEFLELWMCRKIRKIYIFVFLLETSQSKYIGEDE